MNDTNVGSDAGIPSGNPNSDAKPITEVQQPVTNGAKSRTGARTHKSKVAGMVALIEEADALKNALRDICGRSHKLVHGLKRQRKQARVMQTSLRALKDLQQIDT